MKLITSPTDDHMNQLASWLRAEKVDTGEGFYDNWDTIQLAHSKGEIHVIEQDNTAVALLVFYLSKQYAGMEILSVHPAKRRSGIGIGKYLAKSFMETARAGGIKKLRIQSQPTTSEPFWKKLGFSENPRSLCERINGIPIGALYMETEL
jgi:GNAT superfamily N-acetyltransferase